MINYNFDFTTNLSASEISHHVRNVEHMHIHPDPRVRGCWMIVDNDGNVIEYGFSSFDGAHWAMLQLALWCAVMEKAEDLTVVEEVISPELYKTFVKEASVFQRPTLT